MTPGPKAYESTYGISLSCAEALALLPEDKTRLIADLRMLQDAERDERIDTDTAHLWADMILLKLVNDPEITEIFDGLNRWYA